MTLGQRVVLMTKGQTLGAREYRTANLDIDDPKPWLRDPDYPASRPRVNRDLLIRTFQASKVLTNADDALKEAYLMISDYKRYTNETLFVDQLNIVFPTTDSPAQPVLPSLSGETSPG